MINLLLLLLLLSTTHLFSMHQEAKTIFVQGQKPSGQQVEISDVVMWHAEDAKEQKSQKKEDKDQFSEENIIKRFPEFLVLDQNRTIIDVDMQLITQLLLFSIIKGFHQVFTYLHDQKQLERVTKFAKDKIKKEEFSLLWTAAKWVFHSKRTGEDIETYQRRIDILKLIAAATVDKSEHHIYRQRGIPKCWTFLCFPCGPLCSLAEEISGNLLHSAVSENNVDVVTVLLSNGFNIEAKDSMGWTAYTVAAFYLKDAVRNKLAQCGAQKIEPSCYADCSC